MCVGNERAHLGLSRRSWEIVRCAAWTCCCSRASHGPTSRAALQTGSFSSQIREQMRNLYCKQAMHSWLKCKKVWEQKYFPDKLTIIIINNYKTYIIFLSYQFHYRIPFEDKVEPIPDHGDPDELDGHGCLQMEPNGEEDEEGVAQVSGERDEQEPALCIFVVSL